MRLTLFLIVFANCSIFAQELAPPPTAKTPSVASPKIRHEVIDLCGCGWETHYAGGSRALSSFVNEHIQLPSNVNWGNLTRVRAYVQFVVEKDGSMSDLRVIHTNFPEINEVILSVFKKMRNWVAGEYHCETVRTNVRVPISLVIR
ncbi:MAG: hypothetical protein P8P74_04570 [Crocinitomicaceae bacterium]|nr:hypothetical protein [Crocinitomicaceae bacterium]